MTSFLSKTRLSVSACTAGRRRRAPRTRSLRPHAHHALARRRIHTPAHTDSTLAEKITRSLQRLKCPYTLEAHQIQGLNFLSIFPVMQWLVKKVLETREEMSDYIRNFSESQFSKTRRTPRDDEFQATLKVGWRARIAGPHAFRPRASSWRSARGRAARRTCRRDIGIGAVPGRRPRTLPPAAPIPQPAGQHHRSLHHAGAQRVPARRGVPSRPAGRRDWH